MSSHHGFYDHRSGNEEMIGSGLLGICFILLGIFLVCTGRTVLADCLDISDAPLETKMTSAPPNIMFVLDNSGSMDWEFLTDQNEGKFEGNVEYVFDDPGDNTYDTWSSNGDILSGSNRGKWKSQWSGHNKIYYNPVQDYQPWPGMPDADTVTPRSNPVDASPTFDLTAEYFSVNAPVTVDNLDTHFSKTGSWTAVLDHAESFRGHFWNTDAEAVGVSNTATWTADLPASQYKVYAWWRSWTAYATAVPYTINHATGSATVYVNQQLYEAQWNYLGTYPFNGSSSVTLSYTPADNLDHVCADAIMFEPIVSNPISIKNAHYYTWDDLNGDGVLNGGEDVYLVNFVGGVRAYYQVMDINGDDIVGSGELVAMADLPDSVKPKIYDENGAFVRYKTDAEDLQNFANWYSYYRRRELTAKAAVANVISGLEGVMVGFYSINTGLRQTVLPIKVNMGASIIVDNRDSGYQESGTWYESGSSNEYRNSSRFANVAGRTATFTPNIPETGTYNVYGWWTYYSTRDTSALYTITHAAGSDSVRLNQKEDYSQWTLLGTYPFNAGTSAHVSVTRDSLSTGSSTSADAFMFEQVGGVVNMDQTTTLLSALYGLDSEGDTPLRNALKSVGRYYHQDDGLDGGLGTSPYENALNGGACQQAFTIVMTDGYYNGTDPGVGNQDGDQGSPYADTYSNTLADVAMKYYKEDLASGLADEVPANSCDNANHQHMVTFTVSFGVTGTLTPPDSDGDGKIDDRCFLDSGTPRPSWPNPASGDSQKIDDLWHAAVNGRGAFYSASNPEELINALTSLFKTIVSRIASGASVSVNGEELDESTVIYQASYNSLNWTGDVSAFPLNPITGEIMKERDDILWSASDVLQGIGWNERRIVTYNGTSAGIPFRFAGLTSDQKSALDPNWGTDSTMAENLTEYLRGREIAGFRPRTKKLGAVVHAAPLLMGDTIFSGANDGMLHAFDAQTGTERFAYVPNLVFDNLGFLKENNYEHRFFVDMTPVAVRNVGASGITLLVGGLGKGGKGYYALNVTHADSFNLGSAETAVADMVLWEYPKAGVTDNDLGYTYSKALIVRSYDPAHEWVIVFGNGYDSTNGHSLLYILDIDGNVIRTIDTGIGGCNGLSTPSLVDVNGDFKVDYAYAGDLKGNLWKFDLTDSDPANWAVAFNDGTDPKPLFQATGQPITIKPDVMRHCDREGYMVVFGTGKYLGASDRTNADIQTVYGIWDYGDDADDSEYLGAFDIGTGALSNEAGHVTLLAQTEIDRRTLYGHDLRTISNNEANWDTIDDTDSDQNPDPGSEACTDGLDNDADDTTDEDDECIVHAGWYFSLPISGERVIKDGMIRSGKAIIISSVPTTSSCSGGGDTIVHEIDACTGGRLDNPQFDIDNDNVLDDQDRINIGTDQEPIWVGLSGKSYTGILHPPVILQMPGQKTEVKIFSSSAGVTEKLLEVEEKRGILYWRDER